MEPAPDQSFYRRPLPEGQIPFSSAEGRRLFREALAAGHMEGWFALAEQFHTQAEPAFCGLGTLVVVLNALEIDPGRVWKGPWRWFGEELLDCCLPLEQVAARGVTLDELACLAGCNGAAADLFRAEEATLETLRAHVIEAARAPRGPVVVASYARRALGQTGEGHFSPLAGYHAERDLALVLDVARFKYPPHWVPLPQLHAAMGPPDAATGRSRGWLVLRRSAAQALPMYFRLSAAHGIGELATFLLDELPARLASATEVPWAGIAERLQGRIAAVALPPEMRGRLDRMLSELRETPVHGLLVVAGLTAESADVLAALLLALPESLRGRLPATLPLAWEAGPELAEELQGLRMQLQRLHEWKCGSGCR